MDKVLEVKFDVSGLTQTQIDTLLSAVCAQAEAFRDDYPDIDGDRSYPDVPVLGYAVV